MGEEKKSVAYRTAVSGAKGLIRLLIYVFVLVAIVYVGKTAYNFGYLVFDDTPMASEENGQEISVLIPEDTGVYDVGAILRDNGLIERPVIFWVQEKLSEYRGEIKPGTYILNTNQTVEEMIEILAGANTEGQPVADETVGEDTQ